MSNDCWTCRHDIDHTDCHRAALGGVVAHWVLVTCGRDDFGDNVMPPHEGAHPDCPGHEPKEPTHAEG